MKNIAFQTVILINLSMKSAEENLTQPQASEDDNIHTFSLKPLTSQPTAITPVVVDFSPRFSEKQQVSITPKLVNSKDSFQPLFQSPYIKNLLQRDRLIAQSFFSVKQKLVGSPFSSRSFQNWKEGSKPRPTSKYCQLCKEKFTADYLDVDLYLIKHIKHIVHVNKLKANPFQKYIQTLAQNFKLQFLPKRSLELNLLREENLGGRQKKRVKQDWEFKNEDVKVSFPLKGSNSTESTTHSSAIEEKQKKQTLKAFKGE